MSESVLFTIMFLILFLGAGGILLKKYVLDKKSCRKLLDDLQNQGFQSVNVDQPELIKKLTKFKLGQNQRERYDSFQYIVEQQRGVTEQRYICDVFRKKEVDQGPAHFESYNVLIECKSFSMSGDVFIRPKYPAIVESMIHMQMTKEIEDCLIVSEGLTDAFKQRFEVVAKPGCESPLSEELQSLLLCHINSFPFNQLKGQITPMLHLAPEGFSMVCNRIGRKQELDQVIEIADKLTVILNR